MSACSTPSQPYWMASMVTVLRGAGSDGAVLADAG
jgi:hypothetical protein